ncbi:NADH dehydrogenase [Zhongshania aliphaticivorans]|uniref:NADH dehydrogenase n=1 Tax=Zhongshania aliphaticivorans TaxID=1470434 RepID=A0A5S9N4T5_9GAMM|nr:FAD-dependent oxidoreductase [Zhongshania aliphaticivorans]CAA0082449.1 NADH dehydrogenase [Zhongshania aliphaticivorans]CAA0084289.1 NADH dehydrogenase [Zhongshania aliphaticivorans]
MQKLILIGGGHTNVQVLKSWGEKPIPGVAVTLISTQQQTPYSGMLPGLIAGHYTAKETHIDLISLCAFAKAEFIQGSVNHIDLVNKTVCISSGDPIEFDLLAINSGITPNIDIVGAKEFATTVKPISDFYPHWQHAVQELRDTHLSKSISVIGGGAAGIELILAMHHAITQDPSIQQEVELHLIYRSNEPIKHYPKRIKKHVYAALEKAKIQLHKNCDVTRLSEGHIHCADTSTLKSDYIFWCTNAKAPSWPVSSGLSTNQDGFIAVDDTLQSRSHDFVFAAGDVAQQYQNPRPHAGVFAVRQGPTLFKNLQGKLLGKRLEQHRPQHHFLSILALGNKKAVAHRHLWPALYGSWVWRWKNSIDQQFVSKFSDLN